jgi:hypothetical protein
MHHNGQDLLERGITAEEGVKHREDQSADSKRDERQWRRPGWRRKIRRIGRHPFEPFILGIGHTLPERFHAGIC